ncbi:MucR family transcriptional regulator [Sphingomonas sp. 1185]|uniref:MucR family transcriptional regulator n=1 Tax=Sphingomonas sp. 1185 TaxID=3156411 RepID=UPI003393C031
MDETSNAVELATELTIAWLSNPNTRADGSAVPAFLSAMHEAVRGLGAPKDVAPTEASQDFTPAVSVRKSLASKDHIISMIDGKPYKTLRRHLKTHGLSPEEYRERFGLKPDYPMVAESYSESRRAMAKKIGLGRKPGTVVASAKPTAERKPRARKAAPADTGN